MSARTVPWLTGRLAERGGALLAPARAFLHEWLGAEAEAFRGGPSGLMVLCTTMLRFLERPEVDDEGERRFVEGAGALLSLLLMDHLGDGGYVVRRGVHRVRLGRHGFFDPFAAVEQVLDAPSPRAELARQVGIAEAECRASGPISRVVVSLLEGLGRERPDLELSDHFDLTLSLRLRDSAEPLEIDLRRAVESTRDQDPRAVEAVTRRLLSMLPGAPETNIDADEARARLMPRLVRSEILRDLSSSGKSVLCGAPLGEELSICLLLEYEGRARYVREAELAAWGMPLAAALATARENLLTRSEAARIVRSDAEHGSYYVARTGDGRDSARVLLPALYAELAQRTGEQIAIGLPHRDTFMACDARKPALVAALAERVREDALRAPHKLSERLYRLTPEGLRELA